VAAGLGLLVPVVGVPCALLAAVAAGLADGAPQALAAGLLAAATIGLVALLSARAFPLRRQSAILELVLLIALADRLGFAGMLAAAPLAAAIQLVGERLLFAPRAAASVDLDEVAERLALLRARMAQASSPVPPALAGVVDRLDALLEASRWLDAPP
jgi:hypothetical protein